MRFSGNIASMKQPSIERSIEELVVSEMTHQPALTNRLE